MMRVGRYQDEGGQPARAFNLQETKRINSPSSGMRPASQRFNTPTNNRLAPMMVSSSPAHNSTNEIKRSFTSDYQFDISQAQRYMRSADKSKGLRHFSTKVCEKVKEKGRTNYNEVADELVAEYFDSVTVPSIDSEKHNYDMKNIRRRVYDALNVLMAMNIIEKEKKEIRWVGLPTSSLQECRKLEEEKIKRAERIKEKTSQLYELVIQLVAYKSLVERNRERERIDGRPPEGSILYLPYVVVATDKMASVDCSISQDKSEYIFTFDQPFEIQDDIEVLKRLGLAHGLDTGDVPADIKPKIRQYLPLALRHYVDLIIDNAFTTKQNALQQHTPRGFDKKPFQSVHHSSTGRPVMMRVGGPRGGPSHVPHNPPPRYIARAVTNVPHRYGQTVALQRAQADRYPYPPEAGPSNGQKYVVRQYNAHHAAQYMEEVYDEEEPVDHMEYTA